MVRHHLFAALVIVFGGGFAFAQDPHFVPFPVDWKTDIQSPADLSFLLDAPAGRTGHIHAAGGHLVRGDGQRIRLWGLNATNAAALPDKSSAPLIAKRLAQTGINCVRLHFLDIYAPGGLIERSGSDTSRLDAASLDRLDFFVAELKKQGIYVDVNLNVAHPYKKGDGVKDCDIIGYSKSLTYFDPRIIELEKLYARQLLAHVNPYTGSSYAREPSVALVEFVNENSLLEAWTQGRLNGEQTTKPHTGWTDIPPSYGAELTELYNAWLKTQVNEKQLADLRAEAGVKPAEMLPRLTPKQFSKASKLRFEAEAEFYFQTERSFFQNMARFLREDLGVQSLLLGSSDHNHTWAGYPHVAANSVLDVMDGHVYWQHPSFTSDASGKKNGFRIDNTPMADKPLNSTPVQLSRTAIAGKPYIVSEVNHPFPAESACEGVPTLAAYAALQDWDGVFWYTLGHKDAVAGDNMIGHFDFFPDPVKMSQLRAGALMFLRGDVAPAKELCLRSYSHEQVLDSLRLGRAQSPYFTPGFNCAIPLTHAVRIRSLDRQPESEFPQASADPIQSDTHEIIWRAKGKEDGIISISTPRCQAMIGHLKGAAPLACLGVDVQTPFCSVTLTSLDDRPIAASKKLLLTACGRAANQDMTWDSARKTLTNWGHAPVCIDPVVGNIVLRGIEGAKSVGAQTLTGAGQCTGEVRALDHDESGWRLPLGATTWYVLTVER